MRARENEGGEIEKGSAKGKDLKMCFFHCKSIGF